MEILHKKQELSLGSDSVDPHLGKTMGTQDLATQALMFFDAGFGLFLSDPLTKREISGCSEYDPIEDREDIVRLCRGNPHANLEIILSEESDFIAIGFGVGDWNEIGWEEYNKLVDIHGVPNTLSFIHPDGSQYFIFRQGEAELPKRTSGMDYLQHSEPLLVSPAVIDGLPVKQIGTINRVLNLGDWLNAKPETDVHLTIVTNEAKALQTKQTAADIEVVTDSKDNNGEALPLPTTNIASQPSDAPDDFSPPLDSDNPVLDSYIIGQLGEGKSKEETFRLARDYCLSSEIVETDESTLRRVIDASANIVYKDTRLDQPLPFILEMADYLMVAFVDEHDQPQAFLQDKGQTLPLADKAVNRMLRYHFFLITGELAKSKYMKDALSILEMKTLHEGEKITLSNRVGLKDQNIFFDMGDANSIKVTNQGWNIGRSPVLFRRFGHQAVQVKPTPGGDPWKLFDYLNIDDDDKLLLMVYVISLFVPDIAHPLLNVWGEHGSAKSFLCTAINQLCDPTSVTKLIINKNDKDLIQNLYKHYVTVYDNLSEITPQTSDIFCQACTGSSFNKRRLYTDSEDIVFSIKHAVVLNSIEMLLMRQDLIDRSIILHMKRITPAQRLQETELLAGFEADKPAILGGIFDCLVKAKNILPELPAMDLPRMADFYQWGYAITESLGRDGAEFTAAYASNVSKQNHCVLHNNTLCQAVIEMMDGRELHESMVKAAFEKLRDIANPRSADPTFPKAPKDLAAHLGQIKSTLAEFGIEFAVAPRRGNGTPLRITKTPDSASSVTPGSPPLIEPSEASEPDEAVQQQKQKKVDIFLDDADFGGDL